MYSRFLCVIEIESELSNCFSVNLVVVENFSPNPLQRHYYENTKKPSPRTLLGYALSN